MGQAGELAALVRRYFIELEAFNNAGELEDDEPKN
jgi:hypothetical protein